jgi:hypothetical protein
MAVHDPWLLYGPWAVIGLLVAIPMLWDFYRQLKTEQEVKIDARQVVPH